MSAHYRVPPEDLEELNALPTKWHKKVQRVLAAFRQAAELMESGMSQAKALQAVRGPAEGLSYGSLKRHLPAYRKSQGPAGYAGDWRVLLDGRYEKPRDNKDLREWAQGLALEYKRESSDLAAWKAAIRQLVAGDRIPGLGTWREIWRRENPGEPTPDLCPYHDLRGGQPRQLSRTSWYQLIKVPQEVRALARSGTAKARGLLADLTGFDTSTLKPLELIVFDDVRPDFRCIDPATGEVVEIWLLVAMCVATRVILRFGLMPRRRLICAETGKITHTGIDRRDMQNLIVDLFRTYGLPTGYTTTLLVENASAAVEKPFEAGLAEASAGRIKVRRTPMLSGNPFCEGWREEGKGNPRAKGWLESAFNLLHNESSNIKGYIGADYSLKPQALEPAVRYTQDLLKKSAGIMALTDRKLRNLPFVDLREALQDLEEIFIRMNARRAHSLTGFNLLTEWRWKAAVASPWMPWDQFPNLPAEAMAAIETRQEPESPWMRMQRLVAGEKFQYLPDAVFPDLLLDHAIAKYHGGGILKIEYRKQAYRFDVADYQLPEGCQVLAKFNADRPEEGVFITRPEGGFLGYATQTVRMDPTSQDSMIAARNRKEKAYQKGVKTFRSIHFTEAKLQDRLADAAADMEMLDLASSMLPTPAEAAADDTAPAPRRSRKTTPPTTLPAGLFGAARTRPARVVEAEV